MGRIKSTLIKRTAKGLLKGENTLNESFEDNKYLIGNTMPSKRLRNRIAGYVTRLNRNKAKKKEIKSE